MGTGPLASNRRKILPVQHLSDLAVISNNAYQRTKVPVDSVLWEFNQVVRNEVAFRLRREGKRWLGIF